MTRAPAPSSTPVAVDCGIVSSAGACGFTPWVDHEHRDVGLVATFGTADRDLVVLCNPWGYTTRLDAFVDDVDVDDDVHAHSRLLNPAAVIHDKANKRYSVSQVG